MSAHRQLLLPCTCAGTCAVLGVDDWGDMDKYPSDPRSWTFEFYSRSGSGPGTMRYRLKLAWRILRGQDHFLDCVALDGDGLRKLRAFIDENPVVKLDGLNSHTTYTATGE